MIKVLSDATFRFTRDGERDNQGHLISYTAKPGFCDLPDWVEGTDLYKDAVAHKILHPVNSSTQSENVQKYSEEISDLKHQIEVLKQEKVLRDLKLGVPEEVKVKKEAVEKEQIKEYTKRAYTKRAK